jgi:hypothetical protein
MATDPPELLSASQALLPQILRLARLAHGLVRLGGLCLGVRPMPWDPWGFYDGNTL